jgi:hypothetical protein
MFDLVTQERKDQKLTFEDLVITKVSYWLSSSWSCFVAIIVPKISICLIWLIGLCGLIYYCRLLMRKELKMKSKNSFFAY